MPRIKKKAIIFGEKTMSSRAEIKITAPTNPKPNSLTKEMFIIITLYGSAVMVILVAFLSVNFLISFLIKETGDIKNFLAARDDSDYRSLKNIIYAADKTEYELNDRINFSITNGSSKSIFLAPCQYFNKFEKKEGANWKTIMLDNCETAGEKPPDTFEKIPIKEKKSVLAIALGEGVWRGVSDIYIDCRKAEIGACKEKKIIYSNEFKIGAAKNSAPSAPDVL